MPSVVVDPVLCTLPDTAANPDEQRAWLEALDAWLNTMEASPFAWRNVFPCTEKLIEIGRYPEFVALRKMLSMSGVDINLGGLMRRINLFFQDEGSDLHVELTTRGLVPEGEPAIEPLELFTRNVEETRQPFSDGLLCLALDKAVGESFASDAMLVTLPFDGSKKEVSISCTVGLADPEAQAEGLPSNMLEERLPAVFSPSDLAALRYDALLEGGEAHFLSLVAEIAREHFSGVELLSATMCKRFWASLGTSAILEDQSASERLLKVCAAVLADQTETLSVDKRALRKTKAPDSEQRTRKRDGAKVWRLTISKHGAGYRLHFWAVPAKDGQSARVEFANVLRERVEPTIPEE